MGGMSSRPAPLHGFETAVEQGGSSGGDAGGGLAIRLEGLRYTYTAPDLEARTVLNLTRWQVARGEQILLRGISGSGKTTLLNVIAGMAPPTAGEVWLGDVDLYRLAESQRDHLRAQSIGYVFQLHLLIPTLTALENVELPLVFARGARPVERRKQAAAILDKLGLGQFIKHKPGQMSAGQRLRVAVARALVNQPALILADEPTAALDPQNGVLVVDLLQEYARANGATLLVASHDPALNSRFPRAIDLQNGEFKEAIPVHHVL